MEITQEELDRIVTAVVKQFMLTPAGKKWIEDLDRQLLYGSVTKEPVGLAGLMPSITTRK